MKRRALLCLGLSLAMVGALLHRPATAATYYVDFDGGSDAGAGTSARAAWKHAPGDPAGEAAAKAVRLDPGDTVLFKGGVVYRGSVKVAWSGAEGKPIIFDGNTAGTFGEGRAIVDGSDVIPDWQCCDPKNVGDNPNRTKILVARVTGKSDPLAWNLYQGDRLLYLAQDPNPTERFYMDRRDSYRDIPAGGATPTRIADAEYFTQKSPEAWAGAYVAIWAQPNYTYFQKVTGFDPSEHTIHYEKLPAPHYEKRGRYAMLNHPQLIDQPGEFAIRATDNGDVLVYLWPFKNPNVARNPNAPEAVPVTISRRGTGFDLDGHSHITVQGFVIQKFLSRNPHRGAGVSNDKAGAKSIVVQDNIIRHCNKENTTWKHTGINLSGVTGGRVERNEVVDNRRIGGIYLLGGTTGVDIKNNTVRHCGYVGIWLIGAPKCRIIGNTVLDNRGTHANAITVYHGSNDVLVFGNTVHNSQVALASEKITNMTVAYNVFTNSGGYVVCNWYNSTGLKYYNNVILAPDNKALMLSRRGTTDCVVKNNILAGLLINKPFEVSNNLYVGHFQGFETLKKLLGHDLLTEIDLSKIFRSPKTGDYRLIEGSPAIDAGVDVGLEADGTGRPVPEGTAVDLGANEYRPPRKH